MTSPQASVSEHASQRLTPRWDAIWRLGAATAAWGLSFSTGKAVLLLQDQLLPGRSPWFHAALVLWFRMLVACGVMVGMGVQRLRGLCRREVVQGVELGLFGGLGMLLQTDAQNVIPASTSAFFTQFTCIFVPLVVAVRSRAWPSRRVLMACGLVFGGCAFLSGVGKEAMGFVRGEWETIAAAGLFTGQILCLERACYAGNEMRNVATVMFGVKAMVMFPVVWFGAQGGNMQWPQGEALGEVMGHYAHGALWGMLGILTLVSTVYAYTMMVQWQGKVSATEAGLLYATEPVFATVWALFLPGMFSVWAGVTYANERITWEFLVGAILVLGANALLILRPSPKCSGLQP